MRDGQDESVDAATLDEVRTAVDEVEQSKSATGGRLDSLPPNDPLARQAAQDDRSFRKMYARGLFGAMAAQLLSANLGFYLYAWLGVDWDVNPTVMQVWLTATVVEVIGITAIVTRSLFPSDR